VGGFSVLECFFEKKNTIHSALFRKTTLRMSLALIAAASFFVAGEAKRSLPQKRYSGKQETAPNKNH